MIIYLFGYLSVYLSSRSINYTQSGICVAKSRRGQVRCAECRQDHRVPPGGFPTNVGIQRMLNAVQPPNVPASPAPVDSAPTRLDRTHRPVTASYVDITPDMYREHIQVEGQYLPYHRNHVTQIRPQSDAIPNRRNYSQENDIEHLYIPRWVSSQYYFYKHFLIMFVTVKFCMFFEY